MDSTFGQEFQSPGVPKLLDAWCHELIICMLQR